MPKQFLAGLLLLLFCAWPPASRAQASLPEADLKAAFVYNFTKFIEWPSDRFSRSEDPLIVGIFGDEDFVATLRKLLENKRAHGHPFVVKRLAQDLEAKACHILFVRENENKRFSLVYENIKDLPILTIGETKEFLDMGGMFNFFFEDKQLRFEVNPARAESVRLTISSKLLRLAKSVRKDR